MFGRITIAVISLFVAIAPLAASAGEVDNRINHEQGRIDTGVRSGQLTRSEYGHVENRLDSINAARRRDLAANGGHLTAGEHRNLNRRENRLSNSIYFDKHNTRRQPGAPLR